MIRRYKESDLPVLMQIWVDSNIEAHSFIPAEYWMDNFAAVKAALPRAEIYVHEDDDTKRADGFIGLNGEYIEGMSSCAAMVSRHCASAPASSYRKKSL